ncbi:type VI secretion system tip protein TssI/VgrG [Chondromyces apiculatus]|uniref:VgrG protein n=1 Tax=Chondromyces apiculatus DSM 436 TaxID=1192034 RepID=A0A017T0Y8_9BACT|nr:type VI secretion system tip protein TssI/VgrG [Chondromyces apiculatus]EYF02510.1 VgrG protein [Chondromyces apiculatus DSM 436]
MGLLSLWFDCGEPSLSVRRFSVHESMSNLFSVSVWARSQNHGLQCESFLRKPAGFKAVSDLLNLLAGGRTWTGICSHMELVQPEPTGLSTYYLRIVPRLWLLTQRRNIRIFQRLSIPDIADKLLQEWHIKATWRIDAAAYPKLEYRVQYDESDYDFLSRHLEEAGISFFFVEGDNGPEMVLTDRPQDGETYAGSPIQYVENPSEIADLSYVSSLRLAQRVTPERYTSRDHDFRRSPRYALLSSTSAPGTGENTLEQYRYLPGSTAIIVKEAAPAAALKSGGGSGAEGTAKEKSDPGKEVVDFVDKQVTTLVDKQVTSLLNKAIKRVLSGGFGEVAADMIGEIAGDVSGEILGDIAGKVTGDILGVERELNIDLEKTLRKAVVDAVNKKIKGVIEEQGKKLGEKVDEAVTDLVGGKLGEVVGDVAGDLTKGVSEGLAELVTGQVKKLAGDDKGAVRQDERAGQQLAAKGLESLRAERILMTFETNVIDLHVGVLISLLDHPREELSPSRKLLITELSFEGTPNGEWSLSCTAVFADEAYRPALKTPPPKIHGIQSAIVVGPPGQEIHTDEYGRVRVQFHWDRDAPFSDDSSLWIRVSTGWAGAGYGLMTIPRVGHEVIVAFLEGNPDHPVVIGRVHGETTQVPHKLPDNKTVSTWRTASSPGGDGFNELLFEDAKGREMIFIQAERDMRRLVKRDETVITERNRVDTVGGNLVTNVARNVTETITKNRALVVGANVTETVAGKHEVKIGGSRTESIGKGMKITVGPEPKKEEAGAGGATGASMGAAAGAGATAGTGAIAGASAAGSDATVAAAKEPDLPPGVMKLDVKERLEITVGEASITLDKSGKVEIKGVEFEFKASGEVNVKGKKINLN